MNQLVTVGPAGGRNNLPAVLWRIAVTLSMALIGVAVATCSSVESAQAASALADDPEVRALLAEMTEETPIPSARIWLGGSLFPPPQGDGASANDPSCIEQNAKVRRSDPSPRSVWKRFRKAHPFAFQGIALGERGPDGRRAVVVTEPPPHVTLDDLRQVISNATVMRQPLGHDGALFDVVGTIGGGDGNPIDELRILSRLLYRTEYGSFVYHEPFETDWHDAARFALDVHPTAGELHDWVYVTTAKFERIGSSDTLGLAAVTASGSGAVYRIGQAGVIAWWIPNGLAVSNQTEEIRVFSLESDLIIGGLKHPKGLLILGRERRAPLNLLPPLRAETVALLASVRAGDELAQSYQRMLPGAGALSKKWDWAPILLSRELIDSEYGALLNVADQLLKGWSEHGNVTYEGCDYPVPHAWAFPQALSTILTDKFGQGSLTYNWNTTGVGYIVPFDSVRAYALHRTGALPVSYIPGEDPALAPHVVPYEEKAYDWYAKLNDPTLVRVVQYASLYQMFHNLGDDAETEKAPVSTALERGYAETMAGFWDSIEAVETSQLPSLRDHTVFAHRIDRRAAERLAARAADQAGLDWDSLPLAGRQRLVKTVLLDLRKDITAQMQQSLSDGLAAWQSLDPHDKKDLQAGWLHLEMTQHSRGASDALGRASTLLSALAARDDISKIYSGKLKPTGHSWIHTPTVVMSNDRENGAFSVGGHNVRAAATEFAVGEVPRGQVHKQGNVLFLNAADIDRAASLSRTAGRELLANEAPDLIQARLSRELARAPAAPNRSSGEALSLRGSVKRPNAGIMPLSDHGAPPALVSRWQGSTNAVAFFRDGDYIWLRGPGDLPAVPASNLADAAELASLRVASRGRHNNAEVEFYNFSEEDRGSTLRELRSNVKRRNHSEDIVALVKKETRSEARLSGHDYDFENPKISVDPVQMIDGENVAKIRVELQPKRAGVRAALIEFWVKIKGAVSEQQLGKLLAAIELRVRTVFNLAPAGQAPGPELVCLLQTEIRRLELKHAVKIETHVKEAAGDWQLVAVPILHRYG